MPTKKETFALLAESTGAKRKALLNQIIQENKSIALILVRRFRQQWDLHHLPIEDFEQAAFIGVMRAAESYKWGAGSTFSSWITDHVRQELQNLAHTMGYRVKRWVVPAAKIREMRTFETRNGRPPTAAEAGVTDKQLDKINEPQPQFVDYDDDPDHPGRHSLGEENLVEALMVLDDLTDEENFIVSRLADGASEREIAEELGKDRRDVANIVARVRSYFA